MDTIPYSRPTITGKELYYISQAIHSGQIAGDAAFTKKCQALLEKVLSVPKVLLTTSCTDALDMSALLLDIQPGDEVIVPSFAFVSAANAFVLRGAKPVFVDIRSDTLNIDERMLENAMTPRTRAMVPVHYAGIGCEMNAICRIAARNGISIVEDNAHGLFGKYMGRYLGTFGSFATQSFHETKNFSCGEGGALIINDPAYIARAEIIREKGTDRSSFFRGERDKYTWVDVGSSFLPSDILAAFLLAQLEAREEIQNKRRILWDFYYENLTDWAQTHNVRLPIVPATCSQSYHLFYMILPSLECRQALILHLKSRGISGVFHFLPLHLSEMGRRFGGKAGDCPVTEDLSDRLLRLPLYNDLTADQQARVIAATRDFKPQ